MGDEVSIDGGEQTAIDRGRDLRAAPRRCCAIDADTMAYTVTANKSGYCQTEKCLLPIRGRYPSTPLLHNDNRVILTARG